MATLKSSTLAKTEMLSQDIRGDEIVRVIDDVTGSSVSTKASVFAVRGDAVHNPYLQRAWAKCARIMYGEAGSRLNMLMLGDSIAGLMGLTVGRRLKTEWANGGFAGFLEGENGFINDGNGTNITKTTGNFTNSPIGDYWDLASGGSKYWGVGNNDVYDPQETYNNRESLAPVNVTKIGVYYLRRTGGGIFKVQTSVKTSPSSYSDVTGLTAIDTNGTLGVQYTEVTIAASDISRFRVVHVSGSNCYVLGALVSADIGVVAHSWTRGGMAMGDMVASARYAELAALIAPDVVMTSFLDSPADSTPTTGMTVPNMMNYILDGIRTAFPATQVAPSETDWAGKTALADRLPHFVFFGGNKVESGVFDDAYNVAIRNNAIIHGATYVDSAVIWGNQWAIPWDMGIMSAGDSNGSSTHPRIWWYGPVATAFLRETLLIDGVFTRPPPQIKAEYLGINATPGVTNVQNKAKIGSSATSYFAAGGQDFAGGFNVAQAGVSSDGADWQAGFVWRSTASGGEQFIAASFPGVGWALQDITNSRRVMTYGGKILELATNNADQSVLIGNKGGLIKGLRGGTAVLVAGTVTVTVTGMTSGAVIALTRKVRGGTVGTTYEYTATAGSFTIQAKSTLDADASADTSTIAYVVIEL